MSDHVKVIVVVLVGLPASGKSSFCEKFKNFLKEKQLKINLFHICYDSLVKIDEKVIESGRFKEIRSNLHELVRILVQNIHLKDISSIENYLNECHSLKIDYLSDDFDPNRPTSYIIIDDNNYYRSMRYNFFQLARETYSSFCQIYFEINPEIAIQRDLTRKNNVGAEIIQKMAVRLEKPSKNNLWERNSIIVSETLELVKVLSFLEEVSKNPEMPLVQEKMTVTQSDLHKIDLILRKAINVRVSDAVTPEMKALLAKVQEKRKSILSDIRNGIISEFEITEFENIL